MSCKIHIASQTVGAVHNSTKEYMHAAHCTCLHCLYEQGMLLEQGCSSEAAGGPVPGTVPIGSEEHAYALALYRQQQQQQAELQHHHSLQHNLQQQQAQQARYAQQQAQLEERHIMHVAEVARTAQQQQQQQEQHSSDTAATAAGAAGSSARSSITSSEDADGEASIRRVLERCVFIQCSA
jgi:hypothetical protein